MKIVIVIIGALAGLLALVNVIGAVMWNLADSMPLWWEGEMEDEK